MPPEEKQKLETLVVDVKALGKELTTYIHDNDVNNSEVEGKLDAIKVSLAKIELLITNSYVRREEFGPVQKIVYGLVTVILMGVMGGIMALVLN